MSQSNYDPTSTPDRPKPHSELDLYQEAVNPPLTDEFLDQNNLGLGNYAEKEVWQQVESFKMGLFADAAFSTMLEDRRIAETKRELALDGWETVDEEGEVDEAFDGWIDLAEGKQADTDRRRYLEERGDEIWNQLSSNEQMAAIAHHTGLPSWTAPHHRMLLMRHEASRSKNARTQDNLFGRVKEYKGEAKEAARGAIRSLRGGSD